VELGAALERLRAAVPPNVRTVCEKLAAAGHQAVTVGGAVRDAILDKTPGDWDVATSATPDEVMKLFPRTIPTGLQHGTVTIVTGRGEASHVEVTTFRGEGAYTDARRPDHVRFGVPLVEDLARRDLRVNAMAYDPAKHELIDPYGGMTDLVEGILRAVGPTGDVYEDAVARFTEDGLRVMRAVRFAAQLELDLDPDTVRGIEPALPSLAKVSRERVCEELRKILGSREPSRALRPAWRSHIIDSILPALATGINERSTNERMDWTTVWLARIDNSPPAARLGAMLAELAPYNVTSARLDRKLAKLAGDTLRALKFSNEEIAVASVLAATAFSPMAGPWTDPAIRRLLADITRPHAPLAVAIWRADNATELPDRAAAILERGDPLAMNELSLAGADLMKELGISPGPRIGKLLAMLFDRVIEDPSLDTREALLELAREAP
jgi:tRNA nucleotidyltransferase (CCA-adding enzyme)